MKTYLINEIFYSIQGEGHFTGRAAVFVRLSGCNLKCPFCDTNFSDYEKMTSAKIVEEIRKVAGRCTFVVLTGGEPTLQVEEELIMALHNAGFFVAMETNGTNPVPSGIDWITVSPKSAFLNKAAIYVCKANEVKVIYDHEHEVSNYGIKAQYYYIQPCDTGDGLKNAFIIKEAVMFVKNNPQWQMSLQTQKILEVR